MKSTTSIIGILLIVFGILALSYQGFTYTQRENIVKVGDLQITADNNKTIYFPPIVGGVSVLAGIALVFAGRKR